MAGLAGFLFARIRSLGLVGGQEIEEGVCGVRILDVSLAGRGRARRKVIALGRGQGWGFGVQSRSVPE